MQYSFPSDIHQRIQDQLASGGFENEDQVIREAIETLERRQRGLQQLKQLVQVSEAEIASNRVGPFNADQTKAAYRQRLTECRNPSE